MQPVSGDIAFPQKNTIHVIEPDAFPCPDKKPVPLLAREQAKDIAVRDFVSFPNQPSVRRVKAADALLCHQNSRIIFQKTGEFTLVREPQDVSGIHFQQEGAAVLPVNLIVNVEKGTAARAVHITIIVMDLGSRILLKPGRPSSFRLPYNISPEIVCCPLHQAHEGIDPAPPGCRPAFGEFDFPHKFSVPVHQNNPISAVIRVKGFQAVITAAGLIDRFCDRRNLFDLPQRTDFQDACPLRVFVQPLHHVIRLFRKGESLYCPGLTVDLDGSGCIIIRGPLERFEQGMDPLILRDPFPGRDDMGDHPLGGLYVFLPAGEWCPHPSNPIRQGADIFITVR